MPTCDDLKLGGVLSATGITGGTSINSTALAVDDWSGVLGHPGISLTPFQVTGRPGAVLVGDGLPPARLLTLNMVITRYGPVNWGLVEPTEPEQLTANTDDFLTLLANPAGNYLELTMPDTSLRFVHATAIDPASVNQSERVRRISVSMQASPYWRAGGNESTATISGGGTVTSLGRVKVYDPVFTFPSGTSSLANSTELWTIIITGATSPVTVDCGARTVTQAGLPADDLITVTSNQWGWFAPGANSMSSGGSIGIAWRDAFN